MLEFKSPDDPVFPIVEDLVKRLITDYITEGYDYIPEDDGWICVIEEQDKDRVLTEICHQRGQAGVAVDRSRCTGRGSRGFGTSA